MVFLEISFTAIFLFVTGLVFGVYSYFNVPASFTAQTADLQKLNELLQAFPPPLMMAALFVKNLGAVAVSIILSPVFLIVPVLTLLLNGWLIGLLSAAIIQERSVGYLLAGLLPHGIFELPAIFISLGLGLKIGSFIFQKKKIYSFNNYFWSSLRVFIFIVIPLLIAAAIIEGSLIALLGG